MAELTTTYLDQALKAQEKRLRESSATKDDLKDFATKDDLAKETAMLEKKIVASERRMLDAIETSEQQVTSAIKGAVADLAHKAEVENLKYRVGVLEQKAG